MLGKRILYLWQLVSTNYSWLTGIDAQITIILKQVLFMNLSSAELGKEYIIRAIETDDEDMDAFLFSLGCYSGEPITVVSRRRGSCTVSIKDGRYTIDNQLAEAILI